MLHSRRARAVACGNHHSLAIMDDGAVYTWGLNDRGQLGVGGSPAALAAALAGGDGAGGRLPHPQLVVNLVGVTVEGAAGGSAHTAWRAAAQRPRAAAALPRAVPLNRRARVWVLGSGFKSVEDRAVACVLTKQLGNGSSGGDGGDGSSTSSNNRNSGSELARQNLTATVFSNLRLVCWTEDKSGEYRLEVLVDGELIASEAPLTLTLQLGCDDSGECSNFCLTSAGSCFPTASSIFPRSGPSTGGSLVAVSGLGFDALVATDARCRFGDGLAAPWSRARLVNSTLLLCNTTALPAMATPGLAGGQALSVALRVTLNGQDYSNAAPFLYYRVPELLFAAAPPEASHMPPESGAKGDGTGKPGLVYGAAAGGGAEVHVHGAYFAAEALALGDGRCDFGFARTPARFLSSTVVSCRAPACGVADGCADAPGIIARWSATLALLPNGLDAAVGRLPFVFFAPPRLLGLSPRGGPRGRSSAVHLRGAGFSALEWFPRCEFGGLRQPAYVLNDSDVLCLTPAWNRSRCFAAASVGASSSASCQGTDGVVVKFLPNAQDLALADSPAEITFHLYDPPALRATTPRGAPNSASLPPGGKAGGAVNVTSLSTTVNISGSGFDAAMGQIFVRFMPNASALRALSYRFVNSSFYPSLSLPADPLKWSLPGRFALDVYDNIIVECSTPAYPFLGSALVEVSLNAQDFSSANAPLVFIFYQQPRLFALLPEGGPVGGGTSVEVHGRGLDAYAELVQCRFSLEPSAAAGEPAWAAATAAVVQGNFSLLCLSPAVPRTGAARVDVTLNGNDYTESLAPFVFYALPEIGDVVPAGGPLVGGTRVMLYSLRALAHAQDMSHLNVTCSFGGMMSPGVVHNDTENNRFSCTAPAAGAEQTVVLLVSLNAKDFGSPSFFTYFPLPTLRSSTPTGAVPFRATESGAAAVTLWGGGFLGFTGNPQCRFGCFLVEAAVLSDEAMLCTAPWPSEHFELFREDCEPHEHAQACVVSECSVSDGACAPRDLSEARQVGCVLDVWLEVSLNGQDFTGGSRVNFRFFQPARAVELRPSGGPVDGNTLVEFFTRDMLGGFQRLNDGSFTASFQGRLVTCEETEAETVLQDDFDGTSTVLDPGQWSGGVGVMEQGLCGSSPAQGLWFSPIRGGNRQGFGAVLARENSTSHSLTFSGTSPDLSGRFALSQPLDLSRGFRVSFTLGRGSSTWPYPCDQPEEPDSIAVMRKALSWQPAAVPPGMSLRQRRQWDVLGSFEASTSGSYMSPRVLRQRAERPPLGHGWTDRDVLYCPRDSSCNASLSYLMLFQGSHGQGPYDLWLVDNVEVVTYGGVAGDTRALCRSPPSTAGALGAAELLVSFNGQQFQGVGTRFAYYVQPTIRSLEPSGGFLGGGTLVTVSGAGFWAYQDSRYPPKCRFAAAVVDASVVSNNSLLCRSAASSLVGYVQVAVALNGADFTSNTADWAVGSGGGGAAAFIYYDHPTLSSAFPDSGPGVGGTTVLVSGVGFLMLAPRRPLCRFVPVHNPLASFTATARLLNDSLISCAAPNVTMEFADDEAVVQAVVEVTLNGQEYTHAESTYFTFFREVEITAAEQSYSGENLVLNGGDPVTVHGKRLRRDPLTKCVHKTRDVCTETNCTNGVFVSFLYLRSNLVYCSSPNFPAQAAGIGIGHSMLYLATNGIDLSRNGFGFLYRTPFRPIFFQKIIIGGAFFLLFCFIIAFFRYRKYRNKNKKLVANPGVIWSKPSINAGKEHQHETSVRKFAKVKYSLFKTSCEELGVLGEGIGLYYQFLKFFSRVFMVISLMIIISLYINDSGNAYGVQNIIPSPTLRSTVGNVGTETLTPVVLFSAYGFYLAITSETASFSLAVVDCICCFFFWLAVMRWKSFQTRVSEGINENTITCSDYSVLVENVPPNATKAEEWIEFFKALPPLEEHGGKVADVTIALNNGKILDLHNKRIKVRDELEVAKAKLYLTSELQYQKKARLLERKFTKLTARMAALRARKDYKAVAVFVTFEADATCDAILDEFRGLIPRKGTLFRKRHRLKVTRAPEPDVILWENLQHRGAESVIRSMLVFFASFVLLFGSFITIIFTSAAKSGLQLEGFPAFCANAPDPNSENVQETILWTRYSQGNTVYQSYLQCYCAACNLGCGDKAATEPAFCDEYFANQRRLQLLTLVSVGGVVFINQAIKVILVRLADVEKKHTNNERDSSLAKNVFIAQFMNTALIGLINRADLLYYFPWMSPLGPDGANLLTGTLRDLNSDWYMLVGDQMLLTILTAAISPNLAELAKWPLTLAKQYIMTNRVLTQSSMNKLYEGPKVELSERYGALLSVLFVVMLYSSGMPLAYIYAVVYFSLAYWCDKATLLSICQKPISIDSTLVRLATSLLQWSLYLHLCIAVWVFGALAGTKVYVPFVSELYSREAELMKPGDRPSFLYMVSGRLQRLPALPPFVALLALVGRDLVVTVLGPAYRYVMEAYARRQRRLERQRMFQLRKQAGYESDGAEVDEEEEEDLKRTDWLGTNPPYSEAVEYDEMVGLTSYKISKNPRYKEAFDESEYVPTMPGEDSDDDDASAAQSEWGAPADDDDTTHDSGAESAAGVVTPMPASASQRRRR